MYEERSEQGEPDGSDLMVRLAMWPLLRLSGGTIELIGMFSLYSLLYVRQCAVQ